MSSSDAPVVQRSLLNPLVLVSPFFLWGTSMVAMKGVTAHTSPLFMAGVRLLPAGLLVLLVGALMKRSQPQGWKAWGAIALFALVDGLLFQTFLAEGLVRTGAGLGSVMIDSQPLAVAIMARFLFAELIGVWGWLGLLIGVVGISFLGLPDEWVVSFFRGDWQAIQWTGDSAWWEVLFNQGEWLMLLAALSMAVGTVLVRLVCRYADPVVGTGWHMVLGGLPLLVLAAIDPAQPWATLTLQDWLAMGYATVFGSAIAYGVFFYLASSGSLTSLSSLTFLTPVFALLFGNLLLAEELSGIQWSGVGLTLVSIYLVNQRDMITEQLTGLWRWVSNTSPAVTRD